MGFARFVLSKTNTLATERQRETGLEVHLVRDSFFVRTGRDLV